MGRNVACQSDSHIFVLNFSKSVKIRLQSQNYSRNYAGFVEDKVAVEVADKK